MVIADDFSTRIELSCVAAEVKRRNPISWLLPLPFAGFDIIVLQSCSELICKTHNVYNISLALNGINLTQTNIMNIDILGIISYSLLLESARMSATPVNS